MDYKVKTLMGSIVMAFLAHSAHAQIKAGTVIVIYISETKAIIAGDSLVSERSKGKMVGESEHDCKIAALGNQTIFGAAGFGGNRDTRDTPGWTTTSEAHRAYIQAGVSASVVQVASAWANMVLFRLRGIAMQHPAWLMATRSPGGYILEGAFIRSSTSDIQGSMVIFRYDPGDPFTSVSYVVAPLSPDTCHRTPLGTYCALGVSDIVREFAELASPRARRDAAQWNKRHFPHGVDKDVLATIHLIELTIAYDKTGLVGGPVDAVMLTKGGSVKWIRNPDCR